MGTLFLFIYFVTAPGYCLFSRDNIYDRILFVPEELKIRQNKIRIVSETIVIIFALLHE
jgi:hypothetical protein